MSRLAKLEWAFFSALCLLTATADPAERLTFSAAVLAAALTAHLIFYFLKKFLTPIFQALFLLALIAIFFEALYFLFMFSFPEKLPQAVFAAFLISISSQKSQERLEISGLFLVFILASAAVQRTGAVFAEFYPAVFIISAFIFGAMHRLYAARKRA